MSPIANDCRAWVQGCALRVTRLADDGSPIAGANNLYVTDAMTQLGVATVKKDGDEFEVPNACGSICVNYKAPDTYKRLDVTLGLCIRDPQLLEILAGGTTLTSGGAVGYAYPALGGEGNDGVAIEVWTRRILPGGASDPTFPYERILLPRVYLFHDDVTIENAPVVAQLSGFAVENEQFLDGPQNDWVVASDRVLQSLPVATIPDASCGYGTALAS